MNIKWICIKIKFKDFIWFLIDWFNLIMNLIKFGSLIDEKLILVGQINLIKNLIDEKLSLKA